MIVTIDGPAASGKSTTARKVAERLGWLYLDTGAMYRAVTVKVLQCGISLDDTQAIGTTAESANLELKPGPDGMRIFLDEVEVTQEIRSPEVDKAVGPVCEVEKVRELMVAMQRNSREQGHIVAEGRDMGTVVFPNAELKFFMAATLDERARRRQKDMHLRGIQIPIERIKEDIQNRDRRDSSRANSPLKKAEDAVDIDTTKMEVDEQVNFVVEHIRRLESA